MPDEYTAHSRLASRMEAMGTHTYFATGEHEYTRWGYKQLLDAGVGLLQPDVSFKLPPPPPMDKRIRQGFCYLHTLFCM